MTRFTFKAMTTFSLLATSGCFAPEDVSGPKNRSMSETRSEAMGSPSLRQFFAPRSIRDEFRDMSRQHPGFTGISVDGDQLVISHTAVDVPEATRRDISAWASRLTGGYVNATATPRMVRVKYDYLSLDSAQRSALFALKGEGSWSSTWIDEVQGKVFITYPAQAEVDRARNRLASLKFPPDVVTIGQKGYPVPEISLQDKRRPVVGGFQINYSNDPSGACTAGLNVYKKNEYGYADPSLGRFVLTASHCTPHRSTVDSVAFGQPNLAQRIGIEVDEAPLYTSGYMCSEYIQSIFDYCQVDVAVIQYDDTVSSTYMAVAIANTSSPPTFLDVVALNYTQTYLVVGMGVRKVGRVLKYV